MKTILLVDDDSFIRQLLAKFFQKNGFSVAETDSLQSAKQFLEIDQAELVGSDLNMPDGNGFELYNYCLLYTSALRNVVSFENINHQQIKLFFRLVVYL